MNLKIGITGSTGVIGSELKKKIKNNISVFKGDITKKKEVDLWVSKNKFKSIYHLAAIVPIKEFNKSKAKSLKVNFLGTKYLVDAIIKYQSKKIWFFYTSTSHVYKLYKKNYKIKESDICRPQNLYGKNKRLAEKYIIRKFSKHKYNYTIARIFSLAHKNQRASYFVPAMIEKLLKSNKEDINKIDNINHCRDFLNSKDTINAILMLVRERKAGIFNIGSGKKISLSRIIYYLNNFFKKKIKIKHKNRTTFLIADNTKLRKIGWKPKYNFFSELTEILKYKTSK